METQKNILIVDDDAEFAGMIAQVVREIADGYDVQVARNATQAMAEVREARASSHPFDLVITDIKMPGSSGLKLLEALQSITAETTTITMTAYHSPDLAAQAQELNVHAYLIKPIVLSEFRKIVQDALTLSKVPRKETTEVLSVTQKSAVERQLANLRRMTGSAAALLIHGNGTVLASDCPEPDLDARDLCQALMGAQQAVTQEMTRAFDREISVKQSYYGTETYSICIHRLDESCVAATIFGPEVREGQVWYYMREAAPELQKALTDKEESPSASRPDRSSDLFDMIDRFFPDRPTRRPRRGRQRRATTTEAPSKAEQPAETPSAAAVPEPAQATPIPELPLLETDENISAKVDEIDWNVPTELDWDGLVTDTDQGFGGMSFEEAQKKGLIDDLNTE